MIWNCIKRGFLGDFRGSPRPSGTRNPRLIQLQIIHNFNVSRPCAPFRTSSILVASIRTSSILVASIRILAFMRVWNGLNRTCSHGMWSIYSIPRKADCSSATSGTSVSRGPEELRRHQWRQPPLLLPPLPVVAALLAPHGVASPPQQQPWPRRHVDVPSACAAAAGEEGALHVAGGLSRLGRLVRSPPPSRRRPSGRWARKTLKL